MFDVSRDKLANPPGDALGIRITIDSTVPDRNPSDNTFDLPLPDYSIVPGSLKWDNAGGISFDYTVAIGETLYNQNPVINAYWAVDADAASDVPSDYVDYGYSARKLASVVKTPGTYHVAASASKLGNPRQNTRFLAVVIDSDEESTELSLRNNIAVLDLPTVSFEIRDAPGASNARDRVKLWIGRNRKAIERASKKYNVDPRAVVGAIAWEALENIRDRHGVCLDGTCSARAVGPGKVHYKESEILPDGFPGAEGDPVAKQVEDWGYLPQRSNQKFVLTSIATISIFLVFKQL